MAALLVSVRSVVEAEAALVGGAALIDVKEPARGSLGRADPATIADVLGYVADRRPVSAALGELIDYKHTVMTPGLSFVKWGLAGCAQLADWHERLFRAAGQIREESPDCQPVAVVYADWQRAEAPSPPAVLEVAAKLRCGALLIDTFVKDGTNLLDCMPLPEIVRLSQQCHHVGLPVALAGSLDVKQIRELVAAEPAWFAVRGAVCRDGRRDQDICPDRVRRLADLIASRESARSL